MAETMTIAKMHETRQAIKNLLGEHYPARLPVHMKLVRNQMALAEQGPVAALEEILGQLEAVGQEQANCVTVGLLISAALEIGEEQGVMKLSGARLTIAAETDKGLRVNVEMLKQLTGSTSIPGRVLAEIVPIRRVVCHG